MNSLSVQIKKIVNNHRPEIQNYEAIYKAIHSNPELSHQELETAAVIRQHLAALSSDLQIRDNIGGHGVVAVLQNGPGPVVLLRADMDALPVSELTGLEYASSKRARDVDGSLQSVMHGKWLLKPCYLLQ
jgi:metal-dependent amidase/aminoacylase/carboxypeptidase family protein